MCRFVAVSQTVYNASPNQTHVDGVALAVGVVTLLNLDKEGHAVAHAVEGISYNPDGHVEGVDRYDMSGRGVGA